MKKFQVSFCCPIEHKDWETIEANTPEEATNLMNKKLEQKKGYLSEYYTYPAPVIMEVEELIPKNFDVIIFREKREFALVKCTAHDANRVECETNKILGIPPYGSPEAKKIDESNLTWVEIPEIQNNPDNGPHCYCIFDANEMASSIMDRTSDVIELVKKHKNFHRERLPLRAEDNIPREYDSYDEIPF